MKNNYIIIEEMRKELAECERKDRENDINGLLCQLVKFVLQKEYYFLLEFIYPWEWIETGTISRAGLVVAKEPYTEGFLLVKTIPMEEILKNSVNTDNLVHTARRFSARFPVIECIHSAT